MACGIGFIQWLSDGGYLPAAGRVLDFGNSALLGATPDEVRALLTRHGTSLADGALDAACAELSARSAPNGPPYSFALPLADLFASTRVSCTPVAPSGGGTAGEAAAYDLVLNFGGTANTWDQTAAFVALHDWCKPGGWMFHQVPATGHLAQGFFCYQPSLFAELAAANGYELEALWYSGPLSSGNVLDLAGKWPAVGDAGRLCNDVEGFRRSPIPDSVLNVLLRKTSADAFRSPGVAPAPPPPPPPVSPYTPPKLVPAEPSLLYRAARKVYRKVVGPKKTK